MTAMSRPITKAYALACLEALDRIWARRAMATAA